MENKNIFKCVLCDKEYNIVSLLSHHVVMYYKEITKEQYYDKYINLNENKTCSICGIRKRKFKNMSFGYLKTCGNKNCKIEINKVICLEKYGHVCSLHNKEIQKGIKQGFIDTLGVDCPLKSKKIREKGYDTREKEHGNKNYNNRKKAKQTKLEKYCDENYNNRKKAKQTNLEKYGVEFPMQNKEILKKMENANLKTIGVKYPLQNKKIIAWVQEKRKEKQDIIIGNIRIAVRKIYGVGFELHETIDFTTVSSHLSGKVKTKKNTKNNESLMTFKRINK